MEFTVPTAWTAAGWHVLALLPDMTLIGNQDGTETFGWTLVRNLYADGCRWRTGVLDPPVGPGANDLVAALRSLEPLADEPMSKLNVIAPGGLLGANWNEAVPPDTSACDDGEVRGWTLPSGDGPVLSGSNAFWVGMVHGTRVMLWGTLSMSTNAFAQFFRSMVWT